MPGWTDDQEASVPMHLVDRAKVRLHGLSIMPCSPHKSDITRIFLVAAVCGLAMQMAFASPPALALTQHPEVSTITGLSEPFQLGLDEATGDLLWPATRASKSTNRPADHIPAMATLWFPLYRALVTPMPSESTTQEDHLGGRICKP